MELLNRANTGHPEEFPLKVMQFGAGVFLRAFADLIFQTLNDSCSFKGGVAVIKPTEGGDYSALRSQDGLYHVVLRGIRNGRPVTEVKRISVIQRVVNPYLEWDAYLDLAGNAHIRYVVSNTTEAGIRLGESDTFDDKPPREFPAKLTRWLYHRYVIFNGDPARGCVFLPCELIEDNGTALKHAIVHNANRWNLGEEFVSWVQSANYFCNTLVDRIVTGAPSNSVPDNDLPLEYRDSLAVYAEIYYKWVIECPGTVADLLPFRNSGLNIVHTGDLRPHRELKIFLLNAVHSVMVPVCFLLGLDEVRECMEHRSSRAFLGQVIHSEIMPVLPQPARLKEAFARDVLDRFNNPYLRHQLADIALNGLAKFRNRVIPLVRRYMETRNGVPLYLTFAWAALFRFYLGEREGLVYNLRDEPEVLEFFRQFWSAYRRHPEKARVVEALGRSDIWGFDMTSMPGLQETIAGHFSRIEKDGLKQALQAIL